MLNPARALMRGVPTLVVEGANATGTDLSRQFSVLGNPISSNKVRCQAIGAFSVFDGNLETTTDGGTTWSVHSAFDFANSAIFEFYAVPGMNYRFNIANITQTTPPNVNAVLA